MCKDTLESLRLRVGAVFVAKGYKEKCIARFNQTWDHVQEFMDRNGLTEYTAKVGCDFLDEWHAFKKYSELTDRQKERVRHVSVLTDMLTLGYIRRSVQENMKFVFDAEGMEAFSAFIQDAVSSRTSSTIRRYEERIMSLYSFMLERGKTVKDIDVPLVMQYVGHLDRTMTTVSRNNTIMTIRVFFRFLCEEGWLKDSKSEKWMNLLHINYKRDKKIPSVYTKEEVERVVAAIDRSHPQGKRDYAMILLAARYGLRASDIIGLRFSNIEWDHNAITLRQIKTKKTVELPLSEEVGLALIDYIKNARPDIDSPFVFITVQAPYRPLNSNILAGNVSDAMRAAGIDSTGRRKGPHALRHSLASNLLKANETLPVISEILGHASTQSTMTYLRVNLDQLRKCALDVPFVPSTFYEGLYGKR